MPLTSVAYVDTTFLNVASFPDAPYPPLSIFVFFLQCNLFLPFFSSPANPLCFVMAPFLHCASGKFPFGLCQPLFVAISKLFATFVTSPFCCLPPLHTLSSLPNLPSFSCSLLHNCCLFSLVCPHGAQPSPSCMLVVLILCVVLCNHCPY